MQSSFLPPSPVTRIKPPTLDPAAGHEATSWPESVFGNHKNINGRCSFHSGPAGALRPRSLALRCAKPPRCTGPQLLHDVGGRRGSRLSAGRPRGSAVPLTGYRPASLALTDRRRRNKSPGTTVGPRSGFRRRVKSSKSMGGATAQRMAIQPGGSEPPIPGLCKMGRRPNRFRLPSRTSSELNRTAPSGIVGLLASTDTYIRLANCSFGHSGRAH